MHSWVRHRFLSESARRILLRASKSLRYNSTKDEGPPAPCVEPPPPVVTTPVDELPPCPPPCPPICTIMPDSTNPCNYVPPENPDPLEPDMTKIKRKQCIFQQDDGLPIHLKGSRFRAYSYQALLVMNGVLFIQSLYYVYQMID